jgi:hypothetical protein
MERPAIVIALFVGFVVGAIAITPFLLSSERSRLARPAPGLSAAAAAAAPTALEAGVARLAARFTCACGTCEDLLSACTCPDAAEERSFIRDQLLTGQQESDVISAMQQKYGGLTS